MGVNRLPTAAAQRLRAVSDRILPGRTKAPESPTTVDGEPADHRPDPSLEELQAAERRASERAAADDDAAYFEFVIERAIAAGRSNGADTA